MPHLGGPRVDPRALRTHPPPQGRARAGRPPPPALPEALRLRGALGSSGGAIEEPPRLIIIIIILSVVIVVLHHRCRCVCHISHHMMIHRPSPTSLMLLMLDGSRADAHQVSASALPGQPPAEVRRTARASLSPALRDISSPFGHRPPPITFVSRSIYICVSITIHSLRCAD